VNAINKKDINGIRINALDANIHDVTINVDGAKVNN
jgi:hypothetical protein